MHSGGCVEWGGGGIDMCKDPGHIRGAEEMAFPAEAGNQYLESLLGPQTYPLHSRANRSSDKQ